MFEALDFLNYIEAKSFLQRIILTDSAGLHGNLLSGKNPAETQNADSPKSGTNHLLLEISEKLNTIEDLWDNRVIMILNTTSMVYEAGTYGR